MNSYSRQTLQAGWHKTANGPYGAPRGNSVMKAKRVSGASAQSKLCLRMIGAPLVNDAQGRPITTGNRETGADILARIKATLASERG
jgi:hypothetical protein